MVQSAEIRDRPNQRTEQTPGSDKNRRTIYRKRCIFVFRERHRPAPQKTQQTKHPVDIRRNRTYFARHIPQQPLEERTRLRLLLANATIPYPKTHFAVHLSNRRDQSEMHRNGAHTRHRQSYFQPNSLPIHSGFLRRTDRRHGKNAGVYHGTEIRRHRMRQADRGLRRSPLPDPIGMQRNQSDREQKPTVND